MSQGLTLSHNFKKEDNVLGTVGKSIIRKAHSWDAKDFSRTEARSLLPYNDGEVRGKTEKRSGYFSFHMRMEVGSTSLL